MTILRIEHKVADFNGWKKAFASDPVDRKKMGVRRYQISRPANDTNYVIIDLEFSSVQEAEAMLVALRKLWGNVEGKIMFDPQTRVLDVIETVEL